MKPLATLFLLLIFVIAAKGQDQRERFYNYEILKPSHSDKPKVEGWASNRIKEQINRGLNVIQISDREVYISWRLLDTDPENVSFDLYKSTGEQSLKINNEPIYKTTDFMDSVTIDESGTFYFLKTISNGKELETSKKVNICSQNYKSIRFKGEYSPDRIAIGDLNGDGEYDFIVKQPGGRVDPGVWRKSPETFKLEAYLGDGTFLWQKDMGWNIELGIWYSPFIVYDFDGDGKAEVAIKTAPTDKDYRNSDGRVFSGPEYCSILDGMTGEEVTRVDWPERTPRLGDYNRNNRNQMGMAYLDGKTPALLVCRGTYRLMVVDAYQYTNGQLQKLWHWDGDEENPVIRSQGAHSLHTVDLDDDGRDEIVLGSAVLDDNGTLLYSAGVGHSDKCFVTDIDPLHPGMEIFFANEVWHDSLGVSMIDAKTGSKLWNIGHYTRHVGEGMVADIFPDIPGLECFAGESSKAGMNDEYLLTAQGKKLDIEGIMPTFTNWVFWDNDKSREAIVYERRKEGEPRYQIRPFSICKYKGDTLSTGMEGAIIMVGDLFGDWREEVVTVLPGELRIYSTTIPATDRRICLAQDPLYRSDLVHRSMGYPQSPVTSYYLGE